MSSTTLTDTDTSVARGLQRLLGTLDMRAFLHDHLGERMLHARGTADRWSDLFSWHDVEAALNTGLVSHPRMRLMMHGVPVDPALYTYERGGRQWPDSCRAQQLMAEGATLVMMNVEALTHQLEMFVRDLERDLRAPIRVDVVATTTAVAGLKMHWDNGECFNIHLDGEKDWKVVRPDRLYPLTATHGFPERKDIISKEPPDAPSTWTGTVAPGDLIYLPRGWWHAVTPRISPSLHLSLSADIPTLTDYLRWLAHEAARLDAARRPLPVWRTADERLASTAGALDELRALLSPESVESYIAHITDLAPARPAFALPRAAAPGNTPVDGTTVLRLQSRRPLVWTLDEGFVTLIWRDQTVRLHERAIPALHALNERGALTLDDVRVLTDNMLAQVLVFTLLNVGLLAASGR